MQSEPLRQAVAKFKTISAFAEALGVKPQAVSQWTDIPIRRVIEIERITGIPREQLRPDLYRTEETARSKEVERPSSSASAQNTAEGRAAA